MRARGFTLLEVMVAVAILGLGLTAILSAQAGAFSAAAHARNISTATGLLRCKMTELEERIAKEGLPALDESDSGPCCEGDESQVKCSWRIEKPEMPEPKYGELDLDSDLEGLGQLVKPPESGGADAPAGNISDLAQSLVGGPGGEGGGPGAGGITGLLQPFIDMLQPTLQPIFEASARRVTVTATWQQGAREHAIDLVQWVTLPQMGQPEEGTGEGGNGQ
jgi:general secretion pathway protein I